MSKNNLFLCKITRRSVYLEGVSESLKIRKIFDFDFDAVIGLVGKRAIGKRGDKWGFFGFLRFFCGLARRLRRLDAASEKKKKSFRDAQKGPTALFASGLRPSPSLRTFFFFHSPRKIFRQFRFCLVRFCLFWEQVQFFFASRCSFCVQTGAIFECRNRFSGV